jgi:hypothetical protein
MSQRHWISEKNDAEKESNMEDGVQGIDIMKGEKKDVEKIRGGEEN